MKPVRLVVAAAFLVSVAFAAGAPETLRYHDLVLDSQSRIIPWYSPVSHAFDNYLNQTWQWAIAAPRDAHGLPISYLYCAWIPGDPPTASPEWENDVGEKVPNWVESARLHYQYTGSMAALDYVKGLVDYSLEHGQTPATHAWPGFPVGTSNAGDTEFRGFTERWRLWDCHVDLAADIAWSLTTMYELYGETRYLDKAIHVADLLASRIVPGSSTDSPWPYVINSQTGANRSRYAASWDGALLLFDYLIERDLGTTRSYTRAREMLKKWLLAYPMVNGNWVDGHSDVFFDGNTNLSTTCASDMSLYMFDHPDWDPNHLVDQARLLRWTEENFVDVETPDGLPGQYHGAYVPGEQTAYMYRMGYQAARLGAQYAQWSLASGDETYADRAYRCLSYNTYMMQSSGQSSDGPTDEVGYWWSDCYGEATRMYYYGLAAVPEWAPPRESHILYSHAKLKQVAYATGRVRYTTTEGGTEYLRLAFRPARVTLDEATLSRRSDLGGGGYTLRDLGGGDYAVAVRRTRAGAIAITADDAARPSGTGASR